MGITDAQVTELKTLFAFYFGDGHVMSSKFLLGQIKENEGGFVPLAVIATFNKVKAITTDIEELAKIVEAVEGLELSEDKKAVKRTAPLPEKWDPLPRTMYAKGLPEDASHEELTKFFSTFGKVSIINKRTIGKGSERKFKPSVYVEFVSEEDCKKALKSKPVYNGTTLEVMMKAEHMVELEKKRAEFGHKGEKKPVGEKRKRDADDDGEEERAYRAPDLPKDASIKFTELGSLDDWKVVKTAIQEHAPVRFAVIQDSTAIVMLNTKEDVELIVNKNKETPLKFGEVSPAACVVLEGEEEEKFRAQMTEKLEALTKMAKEKKGGKGKKGRKGGKGGKGGKGKGRK